VRGEFVRNDPPTARPAVRDVHNPNPVARTRLLVGTMVIQGVARDGAAGAVVGCTFLGPAEAIRPGRSWKDAIWSSKGAASASAEESAGHVSIEAGPCPAPFQRQAFHCQAASECPQWVESARALPSWLSRIVKGILRTTTDGEAGLYN
jgi:hypothetical protein